MTARGGMYPGPDGEPLHGDGKPADEPVGSQRKAEVMLLNIIDVTAQFAKSLNDAAPPQDMSAVLMAVCGTLAENITDERWAQLLEIKNRPCGEPGCDCHIYTDTFLTELHKLKVIASKGKERARNREGRGLN